MKYILQINTGNIDTPNYTSSKIIEKIDYLSSRIDISKVIFGWHNNYEENKKIVEYFNSKKNRVLFLVASVCRNNR